MKTLLLAALAALISTSAFAAKYNCPVEQKFDGENTYTSEFLRKWQPSVAIVDNGDSAIISRCGLSVIAGNRITCDSDAADHIAVSGRFTGENNAWNPAAIKKFYHFESNFDVQLFLDGQRLFFVENNGRGSISKGVCQEVF